MSKLTRQRGALRRTWDKIKGWGSKTRDLAPARLRSFVSSFDLSSIAGIFGRSTAFISRTIRSVFGKVYADSSWVYVCASANAQAASKAPWMVERVVNGEWVKVDDLDDPVRQLLDRPHPWMPWSELIKRGLIDLQLSGNQLWRLTGNPQETGKVVEIWPVWMNQNTYPVVDHEYLEIVAYRYISFPTPTGSGAPTSTYQREEMAGNVVHSMLTNPDSIYWGMGRLEAASKAITTDESASRTQQVTMVRGFNPAGVLSIEQPMEKKSTEEVQARFMENHSGPDNAGKILIVDGSKAKFQLMNQSASEMGFQETRKSTRDEILSIFGVPGPVVNVLDHATYNNANALYRQWWGATLEPLLNVIESAVNLQMIRPYFGADVRVTVDTSKIPELLPSMAEVASIALQLAQLGYSPDEINTRLSMGMPQIDDRVQMQEGSA